MTGPPRRALLTAIGAAALLAGCSSAAGTATTPTPSATGFATTAPSTGPARLQVIDTQYGKALARGDGKVLYAWDQETGADATCIDAACVAKWPPLTATSVEVDSSLDSSMFTLVDRPDGTEQVAVQGHRLYAMQIDEPGQVNCQATEGWYIRNPDGSSNRNETPTKGTTRA